MDYRQKQVLLKNGQSAVFRAPNGKDGQAMLDYLKEICAETDFLASFPEEIHFTADDESKYLQDILDSPNRLMIVCTVDGELAGNCQIVFMTSMKTKHRAAVMIGLRKKFWNLGIGSA
ncbi:MAG TPA: N-acetyltransferase, partial [Ruminococcaceae bacterium]|nr:N-acetyltransferase [Oscillospiraceae bacterium]